MAGCQCTEVDGDDAEVKSRRRPNPPRRQHAPLACIRTYVWVAVLSCPPIEPSLSSGCPRDCETDLPNSSLRNWKISCAQTSRLSYRQPPSESLLLAGICPRGQKQ